MAQSKQVYLNEFRMENDYVFYSRLTDDAALASLWRTIHKTASAEFEKNVTFFNQVDSTTIANSIIAQGKAEQEKERRFLYEYFGISMNQISIKEYPSYINTLNSVIGLKDDYENLLKLINQGRLSKKGKVKDNSKDRAYSAMAYFDGYLTKALRARIESYFKTNKAIKLIESDSREYWTSEMRDLIDLAIEDAIINLSNQVDIVDGQQVQVWKKAINLLQLSKKQFNQLKSDIFQRYNLDNVINQLWIWEKGRTNLKSTRGLSTKIKQSYGMGEIKYRSVNGLLEEYIDPLAGNYELSEKGITRSRSVMKSNIAKTDSVSIFSMDMSTNNLTEILNEELLSSNSLIDASQIMTNFVESYMSKLKNSFIIFESSKAYSLGKSFRGFHSGGKKLLEDLPSYLDAMGMNIEGENLVRTLYNTIPGAIGENKQQEVKDNLSLALSEVMANFMFDDWTNIGVTTNNAIHIFSLDEVKIPLSYLLIAVGNAMLNTISDPTSYFKVSFSVPNQIKYPEKIQDFDVNVGMIGYWDEQRQIARKNSSFSIRFLSNFKTLIKDLINEL